MYPTKIQRMDSYCIFRKYAAERKNGMFYYEIKKIFQRKVNLIAMLFGYTILMVTTIYPVLHEYDYLYEKKTAIQGMEAVRYHEAFAKQQTEELTEEYLTGVLQDMQKIQADPLTDDGFLYFNDRYGNLFHYLVQSYQPLDKTDLKWDCLQQLDISSGAQFYDRRIQRIEAYLNENFSYGNYTPAEKAYWLQQAKAVKTPFQWGDTFVMQQYDTVIGLVFYLLFVLIICLSSVFSGESEKGIEGLLLSTRHGQRKLISAKLKAAYCFGFLYLAAGYLMAFICLYAVVGTDGLTLPVQLLNSAICLPVNLGQYLLLHLLLAVVICFYEITMILFVSALTKSTIGTTVLLSAGLMLPTFIPLSETSGLFNHLLSLAIVRLTDLKECLVSFTDYQVGPLILDLPTFEIIAHLAVGAALVCQVRKVFVWRGIRA